MAVVSRLLRRERWQDLVDKPIYLGSRRIIRRTWQNDVEGAIWRFVTGYYRGLWWLVRKTIWLVAMTYFVIIAMVLPFGIVGLILRLISLF